MRELIKAYILFHLVLTLMAMGFVVLLVIAAAFANGDYLRGALTALLTWGLYRLLRRTWSKPEKGS